jgi:fructose-specific component phosphotransferase system IIB-like protein
MDLNGAAAGGSSLNFTTSQANQRVVIVFDATCYNDPEPTGDKWAVVTIRVDPAGSAGELSAPPTNAITNGGVVLCQDAEEVRASVMASVRPAVAGTNVVKVQVRPAAFEATPGVTLQATSLTVLR